MTAGRPLRGALIGTGNVMRNAHLPGWIARPEVDIVAASDPLAGSEAAVRAAVPRVRWFSTAAALLESSGIDFVDIATPPVTHAAICRAALERGLHVLCEKPLALSSADARELAALARGNDRVLACVHNWSFSPQVRAIAEIVRSGALGEIRRIVWNVQRNRPASAAGDGVNWRTDAAISGGGIAIDHGWHALYIVLSLAGRNPIEVAARFERRRDAPGSVEDTAEIRLGFDGASAEIFLTWSAADRRNEARVEGESGTVDLADDRLEHRDRSGATVAHRAFEEPLSAGSHHAAWFGGVADSFLAEIRDPSARGGSLTAAVACAEILEACAASDRDAGRPRRPGLS